MKEIIFLNGKFLSPEEAGPSVLEPGFLYGWGLFETMRAYQQKIVYFAAHLERIKSSAKLINLKLPYAQDKIKKIIQEAIRKTPGHDFYLRLTLWKTENGTSISIIARKYQPYPASRYKVGLKICVSGFRQNEHSLLAKIKTTSRILYELSYQEALRKGFDDSIILNNRGYISEGSRSNIFFVKNNCLFTPALACGCLEGITRKVIFDLAKRYRIRIYEGNFTLQDLYAAEEAFFTNSLAGVMPIASIGKKIIGKGKCGTRTKFLIQKYRSLLK
jgi:branched-subunit amino acid aminotransferase/4-amino-4-deoxychorismate lyase